jgi:hypothetical protein
VPQLRSLRSLSPGCLSKSPSWPVYVRISASSRARSSAVCRLKPADHMSYVRGRAAVPPPCSHSQGCNTLVAIRWIATTPKGRDSGSANRFTRIPVARTDACGSPWVCGLSSLQPRSSLSNFFSAGDTVAQSLYRWMVIDGWLSRLALSGTLRESHMHEVSTGSPLPLKSG